MRPPAQLLSFEQATRQVLTTLHQQLPLDLWAVTRRRGEHGLDQLFHDVADGGQVPPGTVVDWSGSMCQLMVDGAPSTVADARTVAAYASTTAVRRWGVRTYLAAPILAADGGLYGALSGYSRQIGDQADLERLTPVVDLLAGLLGQILLAESLREQARARETQLHQLATRDHLTGLATRAVFHDRLEHALELHRATGHPLTVLLIDVDDFKTVNDTHGHVRGDALLAHLARTWADQISPANTLARIGGDEFALLVENGTPLPEIVAKIRRGYRAPLLVPGTNHHASASVGLTHVDPDDPTPTAAELLTRADTALYTAKRDGRATMRLHPPPALRSV